MVSRNIVSLLHMKVSSRFASLLIPKLKAVFLHALITLFIATLSAILVFHIWYPGQLSNLMKGADLFLLVMGVELCLGPLMSLVIFDPGKARKELIRDYAIIGFIQLAALSYGLHATFISRPVYLVFVVDRIELISALELSAEDFAFVKNKNFSSPPILGPKQVCAFLPKDPKERSDVLTSALTGKDIELMPRYYAKCQAGFLEEAAIHSSKLIEVFEAKGMQKEVLKLKKEGDFTWLPVKSRFGSWIKVYPSDGRPSFYLDIDPFI